MSRVGKHPVAVPSDVEVQMSGQTLSAKGSLGTLRLVGGVLVPEPLHAVAAKEMALGELAVGVGVEVRVGDWVEQNLLHG